MPPLTKSLLPLSLLIVVALAARADSQTPNPVAPVTYEQPLPGTGPESFRSAPQPATPSPGTSHPTAPLRLQRPDEHGTESTESPSTGGRSFTTVIASLCLVLAVFFAVAWVLRRAMPIGTWALPGEVLEVLGQAPLAPRQNVHLVRLGHRLLLISVSQAGVQTLAEVTEPGEIEHLSHLCRRGQRMPRQSRGVSAKLFRGLRGVEEGAPNRALAEVRDG